MPTPMPKRQYSTENRPLRKSRTVSVRLEQAELSALQRLMRRRKCSQSEAIRGAIAAEGAK